MSFDALLRSYQHSNELKRKSNPSTLNSEVHLSTSSKLVNLRRRRLRVPRSSDEYLATTSSKLLDLRRRRLRISSDEYLASSVKPTHPTFVLGVLFIIIDDLPHEALWRVWLEQLDNVEECVKIIIHAKFPNKIKSAWVRERLAKSFHLKPNWGSVVLTEVMVKLLEEAYSSTNQVITKFLFASESCIPIVSIHQALTIMGSDNSSWVEYIDHPNNGYASQGQFDILKPILPPSCVYKASQWLLLHRDHVEDILSLPNLLGRPFLTLFNKVRASDEMYFPCALAILGYIRENLNMKERQDFDCNRSVSTTKIGSDDQLVSEDESHSENDVNDNGFKPSAVITRKSVTYADWSRGGKSPETFDSLNETIMKQAIERGCLFMRKIADPFQNDSKDDQLSKRFKEDRNVDDHEGSKLNHSDIMTRRISFCEEWAKLILFERPQTEPEPSQKDLKSVNTSNLEDKFRLRIRDIVSESLGMVGNDDANVSADDRAYGDTEQRSFVNDFNSPYYDHYDRPNHKRKDYSGAFGGYHIENFDHSDTSYRPSNNYSWSNNFAENPHKRRYYNRDDESK